jgi:hypothetical protein
MMIGCSLLFLPKEQCRVRQIKQAEEDATFFPLFCLTKSAQDIAVYYKHIILLFARIYFY